MKRLHLFLLFSIISMAGNASASETPAINFLIETHDAQSGNVTIQSTSQQLPPPYNVTLINYKTGEIVRSFSLTLTSQSVDASEGRYAILIEQGNEELLLDNNGTGYAPNDTVVVPQYCTPSLVSCWLEDEYYMDMPWRLEPGDTIKEPLKDTVEVRI